eukprot:gb/GECG01010003.1/.p1 GENE.gb/GECG01010003.1/~~gb/GECG01010003.1/.p1  ORF type:complete len:559 (+),score=85.66 gb/GECG01010003.1/:1-1677(+)
MNGSNNNGNAAENGTGAKPGGATTNKYDRQIRLWGAEGQKALMESRICLVHAGPTGTETLKNLVLPGCGHITILDDATVSVQDLGNNFFVTKDDIGSPRAKACLDNLLEMNPDVEGTYCADNVLDKVNNSVEFFDQFSVVIVTKLRRTELLKLASHLWNRNTPLVVAKSYGLIGYIRAQRQIHPVLDSKPDSREGQLDLRLDSPFPELQEFADSINLDTCDDMTYKHIPYPVLLLKIANMWTDEGNPIPKTVNEKKQFKKFIEKCSRVPQSEADNFSEAVESSHKVWKSPQYFGVDEAINHEKAQNPSADDDKFWILVHALRRFMNEVTTNRVPLTNSVPDMTATTDLYMRLQRAYQQRAQLEQAKLKQFVTEALRNLGLPSDYISEDLFDSFARNAQFITCVGYRSIEEELTSASKKKGDIMDELSMAASDDHPFKWKLVLQGADRYLEEYGEFPSCKEQEKDVQQTKLLMKCVQEVVNRLGLPSTYDAMGEERNLVSEAYCQEIRRYEGHELHSIASVVGGTASQEIVKLLTNQFVPINNTWIFNGIKSESATMEL